MRGLGHSGALQLLMAQPRLMAVEASELPARVAAAQRLAAVARSPDTPGAVQAMSPLLLGQAPPPGLLLCSPHQLESCAALLQRLLGITSPAAARLLVAQPALALAREADLAAATTWLGSALRIDAASDASAARAEQPERCLLNPGPGDAEVPLAPPPPPPHVRQLVARCPDVLLLRPIRAAAALAALQASLCSALALAADARSASAAVERDTASSASLTAAQADGAEALARSMLLRAPRLLLCRVLPAEGPGGLDGLLTARHPEAAALEGASARERATSVLAWIKVRRCLGRVGRYVS